MDFKKAEVWPSATWEFASQTPPREAESGQREDHPFGIHLGLGADESGKKSFAALATSESVPGSGTSETRNPILRPSCGGGGIMDEDPAEDENRSGYSSSCKSVLACFADSVPG